MSKSTWIKIAISLFLSLVIGVYVNSYFKSLSQNVEIVVTAKTIEPQTVITSDMLTTISVNQSNQQVLVPEAVTSKDKLIGSIAAKAFHSGEIILDNSDDVIKGNLDGTDTSILNQGKVKKAYFVPADMRAITVKVDEEGSLSFGLQKGDKVDVVFTSTSNSSGDFSSTILQNVEVFEASTITEAEKEKNASSLYQDITLLVTPQQAQDLAYAKRKGKIDLQLVPMNPQDQPEQLTPTYSSKFLE